MCSQGAESKPVELTPLLWAQKNLFWIWQRTSACFLPFHEPLLLSSDIDHCGLMYLILVKSMNFGARLSVFESTCAIYSPWGLGPFLCLLLCKTVMVVPLFEDGEGWVFKPLRAGEEVELSLITAPAKMLIGSLLLVILDGKIIKHFSSTQNSQPIFKSITKTEQNAYM